MFGLWVPFQSDCNFTRTEYQEHMKIPLLKTERSNSQKGEGKKLKSL